MSVLQSAASALLAPSLRHVADMLALSWRARLTRAAAAKYLAGNTAYTASQLAGMQARGPGRASGWAERAGGRAEGWRTHAWVHQG